MARKGWTNLSPTYRRRLERNGIDEIRYQLGAPLHKARGKKSRAHESAHKRFWRSARRQLSQHGQSDADIQQVVDDIGIDDAMQLLDAREAAMYPEDEMDEEISAAAMRTFYGLYADDIPDPWLWYHEAS